MDKEIRWTLQAEISFEEIVSYLENEWTHKEIESFFRSFEKTIVYISKQPLMFRRTNIKDIHEALITPHNLIIYKIYPSHIDLISFWNTRKNPKIKSKSIK